MQPLRLAIVGGGVAGLSGARAARLAAEGVGAEIEIAVYESDAHLGGKIRTEVIAGIPFDWGPDSFLATKPRGHELAKELGLGQDLISPDPRASHAYLWVDGRLRRLPRRLSLGIPTGVSGMGAAVAAGIIGPGAALRSLFDFVLPARNGADQSVGEVARRRLGRQVSDRLVSPLVEGVYGAPAEEVSLESALPELASGGSLIRGASRRARRGTPSFLSIRGGMARLIDALARDLQGHRLITGCRVTGLTETRRGYVVEHDGGAERADAVLIATPAPTASRLLAGVAPGAAFALGWIRYVGSAVVLLRYAPGEVKVPPDGSGFLVARGEGFTVAACTWLTTKWPRTAPHGEVWLRALVTSPRSLELDDATLIARVSNEVGRAMAAGAPIDARLFRWPEALPLYAPGHRRRVAAAERALPPGIALAGASCSGVGIPDCVRTGQDAANSLIRRSIGLGPSHTASFDPPSMTG
jgi:protoporphyrinogen/coproporphyrinogen III oxidase